ncbi:hypothetical protein L207DRAFT_55615 [Hyaloscypha variabilis F]|jgi:hypothetical protein|uniref:Uncharacterized protein n=1 Tax=Hyaloscypha variabilis (strain UAMH 11265 / GT02V1 / F) TaxID=1149755 RepID=A0A2J6RL31_HYAVF|nr:hypothetical protein L207DRAFT_55615 [Hyaloscypha variabilis F]
MAPREPGKKGLASILKVGWLYWLYTDLGTVHHGAFSILILVGICLPSRGFWGGCLIPYVSRQRLTSTKVSISIIIHMK